MWTDDPPAAAAMLDTLPGQVGLIDAAGRVLFANRAWLDRAQASGIAARRPRVGDNYLNIYTLLATRGDDQASTMLAGILDVLSGSADGYSVDCPSHDDSGKQWFRLSVTPLLGRDARFVVTYDAVTARVVAEQQAAHCAEALKRAAMTDSLTGLPNHQGLSRWLERESRRCDRYDDVFSIGLVEIDHFKVINASFGQRRGDDVLVRACRLMVQNSRASDTIGRWSSHVFLALLPGTDIRGARRKCEKIRQIVQAEPLLPDREVTLSYGIVEYEAGFSVDELVGCADVALHRARSNGRNRGAVGVLGPEAAAIESI
jgi:diguanylate cyclase (GGDEF)-like protein